LRWICIARRCINAFTRGILSISGVKQHRRAVCRGDNASAQHLWLEERPAGVHQRWNAGSCCAPLAATAVNIVYAATFASGGSACRFASGRALENGGSISALKRGQLYQARSGASLLLDRCVSSAVAVWRRMSFGATTLPVELILALAITWSISHGVSRISGMGIRFANDALLRGAWCVLLMNVEGQRLGVAAIILAEPAEHLLFRRLRSRCRARYRRRYRIIAANCDIEHHGGAVTRALLDGCG